MPRMRALLAAIAVVLLSLGASVGTMRLGAVGQEGTPPVGEEEFPAGLLFEPLAFGVAEELPAAPASFSLFRATLAPRTGLPIEADDPSVGLVFVEAGALTARVEAPVAILRGAAALAVASGDEESGTEEVAAGVEFTLSAGDSAVFPPNVAGEIRNDGAVPAVVLSALVEPFQSEEAGTPGP